MARARLALVLIAVVMAACGSPAEEVTSRNPPQSSGAWEQLPPAPLSPRYSAFLFDLQGDLLVLGGDTQPPCHDTITQTAPPSDGESPHGPAHRSSGTSTGNLSVIRASTRSGCAGPSQESHLSDGAIFDFQTRTWRRIADAPVPVGYASAAMLGDELIVWIGSTSFQDRNRLLSYDPTSDRWADFPVPGDLTDNYGLKLAAGGGKLLAYDGFADERGAKDWLYDPQAEEWTALPADPLKPSHDRSLFWIDDQWVLVGPETMEVPEETRSPVQRAAVFDESGQWRRLPDSEILGGMGWTAAAGLVVSADLGASDGFGQYGRTYPYGGTLDPRTGTWSTLPQRSENRDDEECRNRKSWMGGAQRVHANGDPIIVRDDWALHVDDMRWKVVPCHAESAEFGFSAAWIGEQLVKWGGYDAVAQPGEFPTDYEFSNEAWIWRPAA